VLWLTAVKTEDFVQTIASGAIKRSILSEYADIAQETSQLILTNLQRAANLVQSFKQVAVDQSNLEF
jgi:two-component system, NtrC family, sensor kinase